MRDLVSKTNTPKSTILFYIKEGLLPEPKKPKPNVHIYDERFVYMIEFIKYLQKNFDASINQIKQIIQSSSFDFSKGYENLIENLDILMFANRDKVYTKEELAKEAGVEKEEVQKLIDNGVLLNRDGGFIDIDLEILKVATKLKALDGGEKLLREYVESAKRLSEIESNLAIKSLKSSKDKNQTSKLLLDTALLLKPYIFDSMLFKSFQQKRIQNEKSPKN